MTNLSCSMDPPSFWEAMCLQQNSIFHSKDWQRILTTAFGATPIYAWIPSSETRFALSVFKTGPFRIGYIGFPGSKTITNNIISSKMIDALRTTTFESKPHIIRASISSFSAKLPTHLSDRFSCLPETAIENLHDWDVSKLPKYVRRDINKANRSRLEITSNHNIDSNIIYDLYKRTISRNNGVLRYNPQYFRSLLDLCDHNQNINCYVALSKGVIAAFMIVASEGKTSYYLHGAMNMNYSHLLPTYLLFSYVINNEKNKGMTTFNMMASPPNQSNLVKFKEKWGGKTKPLFTYDMPISPITGRACSLLLTIYKQLKR
jgi:lipid II:glycine glycyltransferase (peptidoglycan interpeptide bridge formation enzyme)